MTDSTEQILQSLHARLARLERRTRLGVFNGPNEHHDSEPISGLDEDIFQAVVNLSDVNTLSRLSQISKVLRDLVRSRTLGLARFLNDIQMACMNNRDIISDSSRMHGRFRVCRSLRPRIFSELPSISEFSDFNDYATAWKTSIGSWDVYMDKTWTKHGQTGLF
jgi:hypothetical protein